MPQQIEYDGVVHEFPDDFSDADIQRALAAESAPAPREAQGSGGATAAVGLAKAVPALLKGTARFAANHPVAMQKGIGAGTTAALAAAGAHEFGPVGAFAGASIRGLTPRQSDIVRVGSQLAGDTPAVADGASKAQAIINYGREMGMKLHPGDIINKPTVGAGLKNYAESQGKGILELFDEFGRPIAGPNAASRVPAVTPSSFLGSAGRLISKVLTPIQGMTGVTDLAQTADPTRTDIGVMGIGKSQPQPTMEEAMAANAPNQQKAEAQYQALLRAAVLAKLQH